MISTQQSHSAPGTRSAFLDVLRGTAIFGVVCVHFGGSFASSSNAWTPSFYLGLALNQLFHFSVPLFVFIAGLLASPSYTSKSPRLMEYYSERLMSIGLPYLIASLAAFLAFGKVGELTAVSTGWGRAHWILSHLLLEGMHPTFYFIPLILSLYLLKPILIGLVPSTVRLLARLGISASPISMMWLILTILFSTHIALAALTYGQRLNYYHWARPNPLFWAFYFYLGLCFLELQVSIPQRAQRLGVGAALIVAVSGFATNWVFLMDKSIVGASFETNGLDFSYVRPAILVVNVAVVVVAAYLIARGTQWQVDLLASLGRHSLYIYLWHIFVLYNLAWKYESVLIVVKAVPELILILSLFTAVLIACVIESTGWCMDAYRKYVVNVRVVRT